MRSRLGSSPLELIGRFADASNATLLVRMTDGDPPALEDLEGELGRPLEIDDLDPTDLAVYKPQQGEAPLWDFPAGTLHRREVAAYEIAVALGWDLVPTTVLRADGPAGPGSVQRFVPHDPEDHYFRLLEEGDEEVMASLRRMVLFDLVIDNADRKGGHVLLELDPATISPPTEAMAATEATATTEAIAATAPTATSDVPVPRTGPLRVIDHGVTLNLETKLRTVAWDFAGEPPPEEGAAALASLETALREGFGDRLTELLSGDEVEVLLRRVVALRELERLPKPWGPRAYPWPPL